MDSKTIDSIVREVLLTMELPPHYYARLLLFALEEYEHLAKTFDVSAKQVELTINSYKRATLPVGIWGVLDLSIRSGERIIPLFKDSSINKMYNYNNSGEKIAWPEADQEFISGAHIYDALGNIVRPPHQGEWYGLSVSEDYAFTIDKENSEIVFTNKLKANTKVVLTYSSDPVSTTDANVVHPFYVDYLKADMIYRFVKNGRFPNYEIREERQNRKNARNEMKRLLKPIRKADLMEIFRKGIHGGLKN